MKIPQTVIKPRVQANPVVVEDAVIHFGLNRATIYSALSFYCNNARARNIRKYALERGAIIVNEKKVVI